ncbi:MAG: LPP20 family lipoprotein [Bacteroidales bacterium]|nr:LPP20 family lipoprotein [Bacteroidales bacterium]
MKIKIIICVIFTLLTITMLGQKQYPEWFLYPEKYPEIITGFSYRGNIPLIDAVTMCCLYKQCLVKGYLETLEKNNNKYLKNSEYYYIYPTDCIEKIKNNLYHTDGFCNNVMTEELVSAFSINPYYNKKFKNIDLTNIPIPSWINKTTWIEKDYYYSVGMYTSRGNDNDAWKTSEERAIFNIITFVTTKIFSINRTIIVNSKDYYTNYTRIDVDFALYNIELLKRWPDEINNYFYTLVRIHKDDINSFIE